MSIVGGSMSIPRYTGAVNRNRRRSTSCVTLTTVEPVVDECTLHKVYFTLVTVTEKNCGLN